MAKIKATCGETADCWDFVPATDPGNNSLTGRSDVRWEKCNRCGEFSPISTTTGRLLSVVFN